MNQAKHLLLCLVISSTNLVAAQLPPAEEITTSLLKPAGKTQNEVNFADSYKERVAELGTAEERVELWLDTYQAWLRQLGRTSDWQKREELNGQIVEIGRYFPNRAEWPILEALLEKRKSAESEKEHDSLRFLIALLKGDEEKAIQLLPDNSPKPDASTTPAKSSGIFGALLGISTSSSYQSHEPLSPIYTIAANESSMPKLQRKAYSSIIRYIEKNKNRYYNNIPDLTRLYEGAALDAQIERLVKALGEKLQPYNLPRSMISPVFAYIRANDLVPNENFLMYLDKKSPTYSEDVIYLNQKREGLPMSDSGYQSKISTALKDGNAEEAWKLWEAFASANPEQAGSYIQSIFGYSRRSYPQDTLQDIAMRLLEISETPESLEILQQALTLDAGGSDALLARVRTLIGQAKGTPQEIAYKKIELDRLLSLGLRSEIETAMKALLGEKEKFLGHLKQRNQSESLIQYARAMELIEMPTLAEELLGLQKEVLKDLENYERESFIRDLARYYSDKGEDPKAFAALQDSIAGVSAEALQKGEKDITSTLAQMLILYVKNEQYADAVHLLDHSIGWGATDLKDVSYYDQDRILQVDAAIALHKVGRTQQARAILRDYLRYRSNSADAAYQALIEIDGASAASFFKELSTEAPFEERPLIWQAVLLHQAGELEAAEKMARQAISIDPTDGEMNATNRLRAYAVLADILEAQNSDDAEVFKNIVAAVDLSEVADDYRVAGLHLDALRLYEESLALFADAYCVRFRAAVELEAVGKHAEAEKHFEAAYTLMPDQFGRIESHCFGCEGAFEGERAESIAERVFTKMLKKRPEQPSLHYLMGYLNKSRNRPNDALENFKKAVELDPLYYNAWGHIQDLSEGSREPELGLEATEAMLKIAPARTINKVNGLSIAQFGQIWDTLNAILPIYPERSENLYRLEASAKLQEEAISNIFRHWNSGNNKDYQSPGSLLFKNSKVSQMITQAAPDPFM